MSRPRRFLSRWVVLIYLALLLFSHLSQWSNDPVEPTLPETIHARAIQIPMPLRSGPDASRSMRLAYLDAGPVGSDKPPIILLHGSPGRARDFAFRPNPSAPTFIDRLTADGRRVYAVDLPGFGHSQRWVPDYSSRAAAYALRSLMDELAIQRAHLVCWSNSGAAGINLCDIAPDRVASLTLMAAVGAQETEGSGSYWFEHAKYLVGVPTLIALPELIPHFGLLGSTGWRHCFIRSFLDNDQRPLAAIMARTRVPTLILHGRGDFLIADWAAEYHHEIMPSSRLVMLDASHFLPFLQAEEASRYILEHAQRHDRPGAAPITTSENLAPRTPRSGLSGLIERLGTHVRHWPFWIPLIVLALLASRMPESATVLAALFVASGDLDFGVAFVGLLAGRLCRGPELPDQRRSLTWIASQLLWNLIALCAASLFVSLTDPPARRMRGWLLLPLIPIGVLVLRFLRHAPTWTGRRRIQAALARTLHHEWWPTWAFYLPVWFFVPLRLIRYGLRPVFTAANPGIENGGGFVSESKANILACFPADETSILCIRAIERDTPDRAEAAVRLVNSEPALGGYPIVIKPDAGQRGVGVALAHTPEDIRAYLQRHHARIDLQRYHPGPCECGVFWMRKPPHLDPRPIHDRDGFIFSINRKQFQYLEGDGTSTIRRLIWAHPRYRCQARTFLTRFADRLDDVLPAGERLLLSFAGNHAQGTRFVDGADLCTPALEAEINRIARRFRDGGFDFGRFDLRYESDDRLRQGRGFAILEVNGITSESTNMYDPDRSLAWAWRILLSQWRHAIRIGIERQRLGFRPLTLRAFLRLLLA